MQRKRQRAVRDEPRKTKETKRPGESRVVSSQAASDFSLFLASKKSFGLSSRTAPRRRRGGPRGVVLQRPGVHVFQQPRLVRTEAKGGGGHGDAAALSKLVFVLFAEAISGREEIPAALLVHLPHVGLLGDDSHASELQPEQ